MLIPNRWFRTRCSWVREKVLMHTSTSGGWSETLEKALTANPYGRLSTDVVTTTTPVGKRLCAATSRSRSFSDVPRPLAHTELTPLFGERVERVEMVQFEWASVLSDH